MKELIIREPLASYAALVLLVSFFMVILYRFTGRDRH